MYDAKVPQIWRKVLNGSHVAPYIYISVHIIIIGVMGVLNSRVLVHRIAGTKFSVF